MAAHDMTVVMAKMDDRQACGRSSPGFSSSVGRELLADTLHRLVGSKQLSASD